MIKKIIHVNKSLNKILLSIKTFDIYFLNHLKNTLNVYRKEDQITQNHLSYNYQYIINIYKIYKYLCINEFQYISLIILKNYCNNAKLNTISKYNNRFKYLLNKYLIENIYIQNQKQPKITNIKIAVAYIYILNQIQNSHGFYTLIQYMLII
nr:hypothetical protein [Hypnea brasiliensis]